MRRAGRYIFNGLTVLSLMLTIGVAVLWVRSKWVSSTLQITGDRRAAALMTTSEGVVLFYYDGDVSVFGKGLRLTEREAVADPSYVERVFPLHSFGFGLDDRVQPLFSPATSQVLSVVAPDWAILTAATLGSILLCLCQWRRLGGGRGRCDSCGYDLRATPDRCPECGHIATQAGRRPA